MSLEQYPVLREETLNDVCTVLRDIIRKRESDRSEFNNLRGHFIAGRKVTRVPSSSTDILDTDRIGDLTATAEYIFIVVDDGSGNPVWRRASLGSF